MLLRLARLSLWLAAFSAAVALFAPAGHEAVLTAVSGFGCLSALGLWRSTARMAARVPAAAIEAIEPAVLDGPQLHEAAATLARAIDQAPSYEAALHAAARVLRSELGAAEVQVHEIHAVATDRARISDLVEAQPGFRTTARALRLDATPLPAALRNQRASGTSPGAAAVPIVRAGQVVGAIALQGIALAFAPSALAELLELARERLSEAAADDLPAPSAPGEHLGGDCAKVLVVQDTAAEPEVASCMLRHLGCRVTVASGMLDGLNSLRKTQFDLILVDLPSSGPGVAEGWSRWRAGLDAVGSVSASATPVVALSFPSVPGAVPPCRDLGFDDHLAKPYRRSQLLAMLNRHLRPLAPADRPDPAAPPGAGAAAASPSAPDAVLDAAALARLNELDPTGKNQLLERVLAAFQTSVARLRPQLNVARAGDDWAAVRLVAHTIKSSSASIGALRLSQLCAQVESAIRLDERDDLPGQLDALDHELDVALGAIARLLKERA